MRPSACSYSARTSSRTDVDVLGRAQPGGAVVRHLEAQLEPLLDKPVSTVDHLQQALGAARPLSYSGWATVVSPM